MISFIYTYQQFRRKKNGWCEVGSSVGMGTNTENGIQIFSITIRIYSNIRFGRLCLCWFGRSFLCLGSGHIQILVHYTINFRCRKFGLGFQTNLTAKCCYSLTLVQCFIRSGAVFTNHSLERSLSYSPEFSMY